MSIDRRLDEALASYAGCEPRPGLPERVLERVRECRPAQRRWWLPAAAAVLVALAAGYRLQDALAPPPPPAYRSLTVAAQPPPELPSYRPTVVRERKRPPAALPKRDVFPTPVPLSPEERALLAFVTAAPEQALQLFAERPEKPIKPIRIDPIEIPPLD